MKILPNCVFAKRDPIIIGVKVEDGQLRQGAPICVADKVIPDIDDIWFKMGGDCRDSLYTGAVITYKKFPL